jgi:hypothetical protein
MQALDAAPNMLRMAQAAAEKTDGSAVLECEQLPRFCGVAVQVEVEVTGGEGGGRRRC